MGVEFLRKRVRLERGSALCRCKACAGYLFIRQPMGRKLDRCDAK